MESENHHELPDPAWLVNLISKLDGEKDEKVAWLASGIGDEILAGVDADMPDSASDKQRRGATIRLTIARYRAYLKRGEREFRGAGERAAEAARIEACRDSLELATPKPRKSFEMNTGDL